MLPIDVVKVLVNADVKIRSYSGRGMYGAQCVSTTVEPFEVVKQIVDNEAVVDLYDLSNVLEELSGYRTDSLGRGMVCYWPQLVWCDEIAALAVAEDDGDE